MAAFDAVLVSDYNKGVCAGDMGRDWLSWPKAWGQSVAESDPGGRLSPIPWLRLHHAQSARSGAGGQHDHPLARKGLIAAEKMLEFGIESCIVTLDRDGMAWVGPQGQRGLFPVARTAGV